MSDPKPNRRRTRAALLSALVLLVALFTALLVLTPVELPPGWARNLIELRVSAAAGGRFSYETLQLSILPRPGVIVTNATLDREDLVAAAGAVTVFPKLWPLLRGAFEPAAIRVHAPELRLSGTFFNRGPPAAPIDFSRWADPAAAELLRRLPQVDIEVSGGRVLIAGPGDFGLDVTGIQAEVDSRPGRLTVSVTRLVAGSPQLEASGNFVYDETLAPRVAIGLEGRSVDVAGVRRAALALLSDSEGVRAVFNVLRGGSVPWIAVKLQGDRLEELSRLSQIDIRGRMEGGRLFIPGVELDLDGVCGDAVIVDGILEGSGLAAHYRGSQGENGALRLGLSGGDPLLALDIQVSADLKPLPQILARVVKNKGFLEDLRAVEQFSGSARGRLELAGSRANTEVKVAAADLDIRARHQAIPLPLAFNGGRVHYDGNTLALEDVDVRVGESRLARLRAVLGLDGPHHLRASSPSAEIDLAQFFLLMGGTESLEGLQSLEGSASLQPWELSGDLAGFQGFEFFGAGQVRNLRLASGRLPDAVSVASAEWACRGKRLQAETRSMSMGLTRVDALSGVFDWSGLPRLELSQGVISVAVEHLYWLLDPHLGLRNHLGPLAPVSGTLAIEGLRGGLSFAPTGAVEPNLSATLASGFIRSERLPADLSLDSGEITWGGSVLDIRNLGAHMEESSARGVAIGIDWGPRAAVLIQAESLLLECGEIYPWLSRLPAAAALRREIAGVDGAIAVSGLRLSGGMRDPHRWRLAAQATLNHLDIATVFLEKPVHVRDGRLKIEEDPAMAGGGGAVRLEAFQIATESNRAMASGDIRWGTDAISLDLALTAESIVWDEIQALAERFARRDPGARRPATGRIEVRVDELTLGRFQFQPVEAHVILNPGATTVEIERAGLCGIVTIGRLEFSEGQLEVFLVPIADNTLLDGSLSCLTGEKTFATGQFHIDGTIQARSAPPDILRALTGKIEFISENGRVLRSNLLAKVLSLLNITEIYRGRVPDMSGEGVGYSRSRISAELSGGELLIHSWTLDGPSLWLGARGKIDLVEETLQLFIVVSPFKTFDRIIRSIPLLGYLLGGRLVAVPVQASGAIADPDVVPMHPAAVGESLLEMVGRALLLPVHIVQPLIPDVKEGVDVKGFFLERD